MYIDFSQVIKMVLTIVINKVINSLGGRSYFRTIVRFRFTTKFLFSLDSTPMQSIHTLYSATIIINTGLIIFRLLFSDYYQRQ